MTATYAYHADIEWMRMLSGVAIFEVTNEDKLSYTCHRLVAKHPIVGRLIIFTIAGHLAKVLPYWADPLNGRNPVYQSISWLCRGVTSWLTG